MMNSRLKQAIRAVHELDAWVHLGTIGPDGGPHVTPVMMGIHGEHLIFSITGQQKKRNIERDARACVSMSQSGTMAHVIVWGVMELQHGPEAQTIWDGLIKDSFGDAGIEQRRRTLAPEATSLGVFTPERYRIYELD
jgi:general stress protein 26